VSVSILLESASHLLLEDGASDILLESSTVAPLLLDVDPRRGQAISADSDDDPFGVDPRAGKRLY